MKRVGHACIGRALGVRPFGLPRTIIKNKKEKIMYVTGKNNVVNDWRDERILEFEQTKENHLTSIIFRWGRFQPPYKYHFHLNLSSVDLLFGFFMSIIRIGPPN